MLSIVRKYKNRKFYDVNQSRYVTLKQLLEKVRRQELFQVLEYPGEKDLTLFILLQLICLQEKKQMHSAPLEKSLSLFRKILSYQEGSFSSYIQDHCLSSSKSQPPSQ